MGNKHIALTVLFFSSAVTLAEHDGNQQLSRPQGKRHQASSESLESIQLLNQAPTVMKYLGCGISSESDGIPTDFPSLRTVRAKVIPGERGTWRVATEKESSKASCAEIVASPSGTPIGLVKDSFSLPGCKDYIPSISFGPDLYEASNVRTNHYVQFLIGEARVDVPMPCIPNPRHIIGYVGPDGQEAIMGIHQVNGQPTKMSNAEVFEYLSSSPSFSCVDQVALKNLLETATPVSAPDLSLATAPTVDTSNRLDDRKDTTKSLNVVPGAGSFDDKEEPMAPGAAGF